jgi:hypothetical protein
MRPDEGGKKEQLAAKATPMSDLPLVDVRRWKSPQL